MATQSFLESPASSLDPRIAATSMKRQGLVGWILFHEDTGIVLHLYRTLASASSAMPVQSAQHSVGFRILAVHETGTVYEQIDGRATRQAVGATGERIRVRLHGRSIDARSIRHRRTVMPQRVSNG